MNYYVDKCVGSGCSASDEFIENIQVRSIAIFDKIDFQIKTYYPPVVQQFKVLNYDTLKLGFTLEQ